MRVSNFVRLHNRKGASSRKKASVWSFSSLLLCFLLITVILLVTAFVSVASRQQSEEVLSAASNVLGVSKRDLVELASIPLNALHVYPGHSNGRVDGESTPGLFERPRDPIVIGYAVSLIKCHDRQSLPAGLIDAALVLRHSIHLTSVRHASSGSLYDYQMFAIVHPNVDKEGCAKPLEEAGFTILVKDTPVKYREIQGEYLRKHIQSESCCGADEFIKLHAYTITTVPIVVHVDLDFLMLRPMDDLFDAMLFRKDSDIGRAARTRIPKEFSAAKWPDQVDTFMTRDWPQVIPGRKAGFQASFLVIKPSRQVFDLILDVIRKGDYVDGYGRDNGWGGQGYGGFVGAKTMQGLLAYVYDVLLYDSWMELNQCRFNHIGMDVKFNGLAGFRKDHPKEGRCRNDFDQCEDCMHTDVSKLYSVHYNQCRKPWNCIGEGSRTDKSKSAIPEDQVNLEHCLELLTAWHKVRADLETSLLMISGDKAVERGRKGSYKRPVFQGHCTGNGGENYLTLSGSTHIMKRIASLYHSKETKSQ